LQNKAACAVAACNVSAGKGAASLRAQDTDSNSINARMNGANGRHQIEFRIMAIMRCQASQEAADCTPLKFKGCGVQWRCGGITAAD
jgi:hypothetical protein